MLRYETSLCPFYVTLPLHKLRTHCIHSRSLPFLPILISTKTSVLPLPINPGHSSNALPVLGSTSSTPPHPPHPRSLHSSPSRNATTAHTPNYYPSSVPVRSLNHFQPVPQSSVQVRAHIREHRKRVCCFNRQSARISVTLSRLGLTSWDRNPFDLPMIYQILLHSDVSHRDPLSSNGDSLSSPHHLEPRPSSPIHLGGRFRDQMSSISIRAIECEEH